jgi:hypothetical protein
MAAFLTAMPGSSQNRSDLVLEKLTEFFVQTTVFKLVLFGLGVKNLTVLRAPALKFGIESVVVEQSGGH